VGVRGRVRRVKRAGRLSPFSFPSCRHLFVLFRPLFVAVSKLPDGIGRPLVDSPPISTNQSQDYSHGLAGIGIYERKKEDVAFAISAFYPTAGSCKGTPWGGAGGVLCVRKAFQSAPPFHRTHTLGYFGALEGQTA